MRSDERAEYEALRKRVNEYVAQLGALHGEIEKLVSAWHEIDPVVVRGLNDFEYADELSDAEKAMELRVSGPYELEDDHLDRLSAAVGTLEAEVQRQKQAADQREANR